MAAGPLAMIARVPARCGHWTAIRTRTPESRFVAPRPRSSHFHPRSGRYCDGDGDVPRRAVSNPERRVSICMRTVTQYPIPHPVIILSHKSPRSSVALAHTSRVLAPDRGRPTSFDKYRRSHVHPARRTSSHGASRSHFSTAPRLSLSGNLSKSRCPSVVTPSALRESRSPSGDLIVRTTTLATHAHALRVASRDRSVWAPSVRWDPRMPPRIRSANRAPPANFIQHVPPGFPYTSTPALPHTAHDARRTHITSLRCLPG